MSARSIDLEQMRLDGHLEKAMEAFIEWLGTTKYESCAESCPYDGREGGYVCKEDDRDIVDLFIESHPEFEDEVESLLEYEGFPVWIHPEPDKES